MKILITLLILPIAVYVFRFLIKIIGASLFYNKITKAFTEKWSPLSLEEKIILQYAFVGFDLRNHYEDAGGLEDTNAIDHHLAQAKEIENRAINFYSKDLIDLKKCFINELMRMGDAMALSGDYSISSYKEELEYIFNHKEALAKYVKRFSADRSNLSKSS